MNEVDAVKHLCAGRAGQSLRDAEELLILCCQLLSILAKPNDAMFEDIPAARQPN